MYTPGQMRMGKSVNKIEGSLNMLIINAVKNTCIKMDNIGKQRP